MKKLISFFNLLTLALIGMSGKSCNSDAEAVPDESIFISSCQESLDLPNPSGDWSLVFYAC